MLLSVCLKRISSVSILRTPSFTYCTATRFNAALNEKPARVAQVNDEVSSASPDRMTAFAPAASRQWARRELEEVTMGDKRQGAAEPYERPAGRERGIGHEAPRDKGTIIGAKEGVSYERGQRPVMAAPVASASLPRPKPTQASDA